MILDLSVLGEDGGQDCFPTSLSTGYLSDCLIG